MLINIRMEIYTSAIFNFALFQLDVFWVVTPCSVVVGYQHLTGPCCIHLQDEVLQWWSQGGSVSIVTRLWAGWLGFSFQQG